MSTPPWSARRLPDGYAVAGACEEFFHATGHPATALTPPPATPSGMAALMEGMARFSIETVGPTPQV